MILKDAQIIYNWLNDKKRPVIKYLQKGISFHEFERKTDRLKLNFPYSLKELYSWHNGTHTPKEVILDDIHFFPGFYWLSIDDAILNYKAFIMDTRWQTGWFPIFANGGGDFFVLELINTNKGVAPVMGFMLGYDDIEIEYHNIDLMMKTIAECYQKGAYYLNEKDNYLEINDEMEAKIASKNNPNLKRWIL